jgi:lipopolysaccharide transport system permease protein
MEQNWDTTIQPRKALLNTNFKGIWKYRDLLLLFVRRDFVANYKQTILGPLWFFIQPVLTTLMFTVVFNKVAGLSTDEVPPILFYMAGVTMWAYFADSVNKTSNTFTINQGIFGKVYFPRIIVPLSVIITNLLKFGIQLLLFLGVWIYYLFTNDSVEPNWSIAYLPLLLVIMALLGLGIGMIISSLTNKYRDLLFLVGFGVQLAMYATPVVYPLSITEPTTEINHEVKVDKVESESRISEGGIQTSKYEITFKTSEGAEVTLGEVMTLELDTSARKVVLAGNEQLCEANLTIVQPERTLPEDDINWARTALLANPMTSVIETFKHSFIGSGEVPFWGLMYSLIFSIVVFFIGILIFNRVEKSFIDTV